VALLSLVTNFFVAAVLLEGSFKTLILLCRDFKRKTDNLLLYLL
jgi:hypothetical protein